MQHSDATSAAVRWQHELEMGNYVDCPDQRFQYDQQTVANDSTQQREMELTDAYNEDDDNITGPFHHMQHSDQCGQHNESSLTSQTQQQTMRSPHRGGECCFFLRCLFQLTIASLLCFFISGRTGGWAIWQSTDRCLHW
jgi:hypothetical protein